MSKQTQQEAGERLSFYDKDRPCHRLIPFFFIGFSVLLGFFMYTGISGVLGAFVRRVLLGCFSFFAYAIPPMVLIHGLFWRYEILKHRAISHGVYALLFLLMANALWFTFSPAASELSQVVLGSYYTSAQTLTAPGMLGVMVGYALRYTTGVVGAPLLAAMLIVMFIYHFLGITPWLVHKSKEAEVGAADEEEEAFDYEPVYADDEEPVDETPATANPESERVTMTLKDKLEKKRADRAAARAEAQAAKEAKRAEKAAQKGASPVVEGYYPETDETFDEIRARMVAEERRHQKQERRKKAPVTPRAVETTPSAPRRSRVGAVDVDIPLEVRTPVGTTTTTPATAPVHPTQDVPPSPLAYGTSEGDAASADDVFSRFDPVAGDSLISHGSPVWRTGDSSLIYDDRKPEPTPTRAPIDKSKIRKTEGGVVSESGGKGSFCIQAEHLDIPSSRDRRPRTPVRTPVSTPAQEDEGYTTDISDILAGIAEEENKQDIGAMPTPEPLPMDETVEEFVSVEEMPDVTPVDLPVDTEEDSDAEGEQDYVFEPYVPPTTSTETEDVTEQVAPPHDAPTKDSSTADKAPTRKGGPDYSHYVFPPISLLDNSHVTAGEQNEAEINDMINRLIREFRKFKIEIKVHAVTVGPRITRYSISPPDGTRISTILNLANDIALGLAVKSIRIEPVPGTPYLGIEIPNTHPSKVPLASLIDNEMFRNSKTVTTVALGASITGQPVLADLTKMPHVLVAGATGMGKSVFLNSILISLFYRARPDEVKLILVDPKRVELSVYKGIPHLLIPPVVEAQKAAGALIWAVGEMERRYNLMTEVGVRSIEGYNEAVRRDPSKGQPQPKIIIAIDELNDLMMQARDAVEPAIMSIAQKARAAGIHLIVCTQRPSVDVITGVIKANIPSRIALHVSSGTDSRTILDFYGAEKLLDRGDMLAAIAGAEVIRVQSAFVSDEEVENVTAFLKRNAGDCVYDEIISSQIDAETEKYRNSGKRAEKGGADDECADTSIFEDSKFIQVCDVAFKNGKISTSLVQRHCGIGYGRAAKYIDIMQSMGIVSPPDGSKPRDVLMSRDQFMEMVARESASGE